MKLLEVSITSWDVGKHSAAFDCIHDTDLALDAYLNKNTRTDTGIQILFIYGALQALVVLIDSVSCIYRDFYDQNFRRHENAIFKECIDFRDMAIGHPVKTEEKHSKFPGYSHFILRHKIDESSLHLHSRNTNDTKEWISSHICIDDLIKRVRTEASRLLEVILTNDQ